MTTKFKKWLHFNHKFTNNFYFLGISLQVGRQSRPFGTVQGYTLFRYFVALRTKPLPSLMRRVWFWEVSEFYEVCYKIKEKSFYL